MPLLHARHCFGTTRSLTQAYTKSGVNINCIAPGVIDNAFHAVNTHPEQMTRMVERIPQVRYLAHIALHVNLLGASRISYLSYPLHDT